MCYFPFLLLLYNLIQIKFNNQVSPKASNMATQTTATESVDYDEVIDNVDMATAAALKFQFKTAQGYLNILLNLLPSLKPALRVYKNALTSIAEGLADEAITKTQATKELEGENNKLKIAAMKATKDAESDKPRFGEQDLLKDLNRDSLKVYDTNMNQVQTHLNKHGIFAGYVPILPITQPALDTSKLKKAGIASDNFAGYSILKKEFVAGITSEALHKLIAAEKTIKTSPKSEAARTDAALEEFKKIIEAKYKHLKLVQMGEVTGYWGAYWIWYAPASLFKTLKHCTMGISGGDSLKLRQWSFPFKR